MKNYDYKMFIIDAIVVSSLIGAYQGYSIAINIAKFAFNIIAWTCLFISVCAILNPKDFIDTRLFKDRDKLFASTRFIIFCAEVIALAGLGWFYTATFYFLTYIFISSAKHKISEYKKENKKEE